MMKVTIYTEKKFDILYIFITNLKKNYLSKLRVKRALSW